MTLRSSWRRLKPHRLTRETSLRNCRLLLAMPPRLRSTPLPLWPLLKPQTWMRLRRRRLVSRFRLHRRQPLMLYLLLPPLLNRSINPLWLMRLSLWMRLPPPLWLIRWYLLRSFRKPLRLSQKPQLLLPSR